MEEGLECSNMRVVLGLPPVSFRYIAAWRPSYMGNIFKDGVKHLSNK